MEGESPKKLPTPHHLFAIEPDVEIAADTVDVRFGRPIGARVPGIGMTESDVHTGNFFVLQNISDHVSARGVGADGEFADAVAVFVRRRVSAKFFQQLLVLTPKIDNITPIRSASRGRIRPAGSGRD